MMWVTVTKENLHEYQDPHIRKGSVITIYMRDDRGHTKATLETGYPPANILRRVIGQVVQWGYEVPTIQRGDGFVWVSTNPANLERDHEEVLGRVDTPLGPVDEDPTGVYMATHKEANCGGYFRCAFDLCGEHDIELQITYEETGTRTLSPCSERMKDAHGDPDPDPDDFIV